MLNLKYAQIDIFAFYNLLTFFYEEKDCRSGCIADATFDLSNSSININRNLSIEYQVIKSGRGRGFMSP